MTLTESEKVKRIARVLLKRYPEIMSKIEAIHVAYLILEALNLPPLKSEVKSEVKPENKPSE